MANSDKQILITPNIGQTANPKIEFKGADASTGPQTITLQVYPNNNGTLSFEGSAGQLLSITNSMSGTIFSVNDVSGIPSIEVLDTGLVKIAQYGGNVLLGTGSDNGSDKLQVNGSISSNQNVQVISTNTTASTSRLYVLTASLTLTLPASPAVGNWVQISNRSGASPVVARNGQNIMSLAEDMTIDANNASFTLTFVDSTRGWTITA